MKWFAQDPKGKVNIQVDIREVEQCKDRHQKDMTRGTNTVETVTNTNESTESKVSALSPSAQPTENEVKLTPTKPGASVGPTAFLVIAHRGGDSDNHSYPVGVATSLLKAREIKEAAEIYRGGKYSCSIWSFIVDQTDLDADTDVELVRPTPLPGWKTAIDKIRDDQERDRKINMMTRNGQETPEHIRDVVADYPVILERLIAEKKITADLRRQLAERERKPEECENHTGCGDDAHSCMKYGGDERCPCAAWTPKQEKKGKKK